MYIYIYMYVHPDMIHMIHHYFLLIYGDLFFFHARTVKLIDFGLATRFYGYLPQDQYIEIVGAVGNG